MNAEIRHLPIEKDSPAGQMRAEVQFDDYEPTASEIADLWERVGEDEIDADSPSEALNAVWARWNAGSGRESVAFARRECKDCDAVFTGERSDDSVDLGLRQKNAEKHHNDTMMREGTPHEVEKSTRSLSVGDIVVIDGTAHLCQSIGWSELEEL